MSNDDLPTYDEFAHRQQHPLKDVTVHRQEVEEIVQKLLKLEARTHPQNSDPGEKELDSISALIWAGKLVEKLAGWAMDHRAGMILNGATVYPWPEGDQKAQLQANDHRHEEIGSAFLQDGQSDASIETRLIVGEITARAALVPPALRDQFSEAIKALDFGEVRPFFQPLKGQRKNAYTEWLLRLRAVEHTHFLDGTGQSLEVARKQVAQAYGVSSDAVESWDTGPGGLIRRFGESTLNVVRGTANRCGEQFQRLQMQLRKSELDETMIRGLLLTYGSESLAVNAQRFKKAQRASLNSDQKNP